MPSNKAPFRKPTGIYCYTSVLRAFSDDVLIIPHEALCTDTDVSLRLVLAISGNLIINSYVWHHRLVDLEICQFVLKEVLQVG